MSEGVSQAAWGSWAFPFWATAGLIATALLYLRGWRKIRRTRPLIFPAWRAWCFLGGLLALWIAIASPLDTLDGLLLTAHMTQHLILMSVVPPLLLLGAPAVPLLRALPRSVLRDGLGPFFRTPALYRVAHLLTHPVFAWLAMNIAYLGWHVPPAYELALRSPGWHEVEHACFLGTSLLFWFPVIQPWPSVARGSRWAILPYLVGADLVNTALSASLSFSGRVIYPSYANGPRVFGISALGDQAAAGALMWVIGSIFYLVPVMVIAVHLLSPRSNRPAEVSRGSVATESRNALRPAAVAFDWSFAASAVRPHGFAKRRLCDCGPGDRGWFRRPSHRRHEPGRRTAVDLRAGLRRNRSAGAGQYLLHVLPLHAAAGTGTPVGSGSIEVAALAAHQVGRDRSDDNVLLVVRSFCYLGPPRAHRVAAGRLLCRRFYGRHVFSRGQLLQVRLPAGTI